MSAITGFRILCGKRLTDRNPKGIGIKKAAKATEPLCQYTIFLQENISPDKVFNGTADLSVCGGMRSFAPPIPGKRGGVEFTNGCGAKAGKPKSAPGKRDVPLNQAAIEAVLKNYLICHTCADMLHCFQRSGRYVRG